MPLAVIAVIVLLLKVFEIGPVANWSWWWVLAPFGLLFLWWEVIAPMIGWNKRTAELKMKKEAESAEEMKRKQRGF
jgi:small Trp-rich protein